MISRVDRELRKPRLDTLLRIALAMAINLWPLTKKSETPRDTPKIAQ